MSGEWDHALLLIIVEALTVPQLDKFVSCWPLHYRRPAKRKIANRHGRDILPLVY